MIELSKRYMYTSLSFGRVYEEIHVGPYGTGKTRAIMEGFGNWCLTHPPGKLGFLLAGKTAALAKSNMGDMLTDLFKDDFKFTSGKADGKTKDALLFGHRIYFGGFSDKDSIERILGKSYKAIIIDEVTSIKEEHYIQIKGRLRGEAPHWIIGSTNPGSPNHWLYKYLGLDIDDELEQKAYRKEKNIHLIQWNISDARYDGADEYYNNLKRQYPLGSVYYERGILGHWRSAGDLVYGDTFKPNECIYSANELNNATYKYYKVGIDFGMENPTVALLIGVMPEGEHVVIYEKYMPHAKNLNFIVNEIMHMLNYKMHGKCIGVYIDPSAAVLIKALKESGLTNIKKANNSVVDGIQTVNTYLATGKLVISDICKETINEFYTYQYSKKDTEVVEKRYDHCMDALRYALHTK